MRTASGGCCRRLRSFFFLSPLMLYNRVKKKYATNRLTKKELDTALMTVLGQDRSKSERRACCPLRRVRVNRLLCCFSCASQRFHWRRAAQRAAVGRRRVFVDVHVAQAAASAGAQIQRDRRRARLHKRRYDGRIVVFATFIDCNEARLLQTRGGEQKSTRSVAAAAHCAHSRTACSLRQPPSDSLTSTTRPST